MKIKSINKDWERVSNFISSYGYSQQIERSYRELVSSEVTTYSQMAKHTGYLRTFFIYFIKETAKKIANVKNDDILKIKGGNSEAKYKSYLKKIDIITKTESEYINKLYSLLSEGGGSHKLSTSKEKYRFFFNTAFEFILLLIPRVKLQLQKKSDVSERIPPLTEPQFEKIMKFVKKKKHRLAFILSFMSGLSGNEIIKLEKSNFDLVNKIIKLPETKMFNSREVPLTKAFENEHLELIPIECSLRALQKSFVSHVKKADLINLNLQLRSLKKGFALKKFLNKECSYTQLQKLIGHKRMSATAEWIKEFESLDKKNYSIKI